MRTILCLLLLASSLGAERSPAQSPAQAISGLRPGATSASGVATVSPHFTSRSTWTRGTSQLPRQLLNLPAQPRAATATTPGPWLQARTPLPTGEVPTSVAMGDFNRDGKLDWIVANGWDDNLWLYLGNGDGTAALPTILPLRGTSPLWVASADLRGDGKSDIVVAEHDTNLLGVLLSNGDGTFQNELELTTPFNPDYVTVADINGDGHPDIIGGGTGCAFVFLGNGKGNFGAPMTSCAQNISVLFQTPPNFTTFVSFADFNQDGKLDLLISEPGDGVEMLLGDGLGHFASPVRIVDGFALSNEEYFYFTSTALDFNGDGCPDAAVGDWNGKVFLFAGDCAGNFRHPATLSFMMGDVPSQLSVADINRDGHPDLIASGIHQFGSAISSGHQLMVSLGDGHGGFQNAQVYRGGDNLAAFAVGDLNGDGAPDVLSVAQNENGVYEFLNDGTGGFGSPQGRAQFSIHGNNNQEIEPFNVGFDYAPLEIDVNGDGLKDVVYLDYADLEGTWSVGAALNLGARGFANPVFSTINTNKSYVVSDTAGDFHGNGRPDLLVATDPGQPGGPGGAGAVYLMQNLGGGTFGSPVVVFNHANVETTMWAADLNGDGKQDLIVSDLVSPSGPQLYVLLGNGNGTFQAPIATPVPGLGNSASIFVGDYNGDKKNDVLLFFNQNTTPASSNVYELLGNGDGTFQPARPLFTSSSGLPSMHVVDLNHDGHPDILSSDNTYGAPSLTTYFGQPDGTFAQPLQYPPLAPGWQLNLVNPGVGDFNHDGNLDFPFTFYSGPGPYQFSAQFYRGNSDGTFSPTQDVFSSGESQPLWDAADMDGTGTSSMVEYNSLSDSFDVLKGGPAPPFQLSLQSEAIVANTAQGTISLNQASSTATTVNLQYSDPAAAGPSAVAIAAGLISQNFTITLQSGFTPKRVLEIKASLGAYTTSAYAFDEAAFSPLTVNAPNVNFGLVPLGTSSSPLTITVINNTLAPVTLGTINFAVTPNPDYTEADNCHTPIAAGGSCTFTVTFKPTIGNQQSNVQLSFTDPVSGRAYTFVFTGTGEQAIAQLAPPALNFGSQPAGTVSNAQVVYLSNIGTGFLHVTSSTITGPFQLQSTCTSIAQYTPCQMFIAFAPASAGQQTGSLTVSTDGAVPTQTVSLTGTAAPANTISIAPSSVAFAAQPVGTQSTSQTIILTNTGVNAISIANIVIANSLSFVQNSNCSGSLAPASTCQANVIFVPDDTSLSQGALQIADNATGSPQRVALTGQGVALLIASSPASQTVVSGSDANYAVTVSESSSYSATMAMSCAGLPVYATCAFSPATVNLSSGTSAATSLTINTGSATTLGRSTNPLWPAGGILSVLSIPLVLPRKYRKRLKHLHLAVVLFAGALSITCCGGGSSAPSASPSRQTTPPGTYTVTVTSSGNGITLNGNVTLVVQ